jgi:hypothetical protein
MAMPTSAQGDCATEATRFRLSSLGLRAALTRRPAPARSTFPFPEESMSARFFATALLALAFATSSLAKGKDKFTDESDPEGSKQMAKGEKETRKGKKDVKQGKRLLDKAKDDQHEAKQAKGKKAARLEGKADAEREEGKHLIHKGKKLEKKGKKDSASGDERHQDALDD